MRQDVVMGRRQEAVTDSGSVKKAQLLRSISERCGHALSSLMDAGQKPMSAATE
jgi:hypothetical protein